VSKKTYDQLWSDDLYGLEGKQAQLSPDQPQAQDPNSVTGVSSAVIRRAAAGRDFPISQWIVKSGGRYAPCGTTISKLPAAIYVVGSDNNGPFLEVARFPTDELLRFPDGPIQTVVDRAERFWKSKEKYEALGLLHKTGILLYGPAGCGKSSAIKLLIQDLIKRGGIVLITDRPRFMPMAFRMIRDIEKERPIVNIIEDIDDKMREPEDSTILLAMLDGEHQTDNILQIATTNYPERLEERITQRPGRFDLIVRMELPSEGSREFYLQRFLNSDRKRLDKWVKDTNGLGVSHMRELVASVEGLGLDYDETLARLKLNKKKPPKRKADVTDFGFKSPEEIRR